MIVETDASEIGYGGILKQMIISESPQQLVRFTSGIWNSAQKNYSTVKKEVLSRRSYKQRIFSKSRLQICQRDSSKGCQKSCFKINICKMASSTSYL